MERSKKKSDGSVCFIFKYLKRHSIAYAIGLLSLFVVDFVNLYIPQFTGELFDGLTYGVFSKADIIRYVKLISGTGLIIMAMRFIWRYTLFGSCRKIEFEIRKDLYEHLSKQSVNFYNNNKTGDLMSYFTNDLGAIRNAVGAAVVSTFDATVMTVMVLVKMLLYVNITLTLICVIPMLLILWGGIRYGKEIEKRFDKKQEAFSEMSDHVQETVSGIRVIKAFVQEREELESFSKVNAYNKKTNLRIVSLMAVVMPLLDLLIGLSFVFALLYGGRLVVTGVLSPGLFVSFISYLGMLVWPMIAMGDSITSFSQGIASMKRIGELFLEVPEVSDTSKTDKNITNLEGAIEFRNLSFKYRESLPDVLSGISLTVPKGESLAIVGKTGCGKSTIANLLIHLYNVPDGMIFFDGKDINTIPLETLRSKIAYVQQDNFLFSDTLQTNIAFGKRKYKKLKTDRKADKKLFLSKAESVEAYLEEEFEKRESAVDKAYADLNEVEEAAKAACIHDNIMEFPKGYATIVGERGVTVSGGQKQRSSIARALMKESPILILDDAMSAVDTDTEDSILSNLRELRKGKTTIIIAHRISTVEHCDRIAVLEDGKIAEYGTHNDLVKLGGFYAELYEKQRLEAELG